MQRFDRRLAEERLAGLPLSPANRRLADYWLGLWDGDALPVRARFSPAAVRDHLPGIMIQEILADVRVAVRLCGTAINEAFGRDLTGCDLIAISPESTRALRLAHHNDVARGAIGFGLRQGKTRFGVDARSEEVHLPFGDVGADGARLVLFHTNWRSRGAIPGTAEVPDVLGIPVDFRILPLWHA